MRWRTGHRLAYPPRTHMPRKAPSWPQVRRGTLTRVFGRSAVGSRCGGQGRAGLGVGCGVLDRFASLICPSGDRRVQTGKGSAQAALATLEPARTFRRVKSWSPWPCTSLALARQLHSMGIPLPLHYRQGSNRGDGRYMLGHTGHKHCRGTYASTHACKHVRGTHCKHGHAACEAWTTLDTRTPPLTGTNRHVRGLGTSVVKRRQGRVTNGYPTRPHFRPQATTAHISPTRPC